jgi:putative DNA primase/helicase
VFADLLKSSSMENRGTAGPAFVEWLIGNEAEARKKIKVWMKEFSDKYVPPNSSGEIYRVADRFALVGAAGKLATEAGITGWQQGAAMEAAGQCFKRWLAGRCTGSLDLEKAIDQVRGCLLTNESRFELLSDDRDGFPVTDPRPTPIPNRLGFRQTIGTGATAAVEYLITSGAFKNEVCKGYDATKVAGELAKRGHLRKSKGRLQVQQRIPGMGSKAARFYAIQSSILGEDDEREQEESEAA